MDLDELAKQYGGVSATPEPVNLDNLAKELGGTSRPVKERTVTEAFTDPAAKFASGIGQLIQFPGQIYGLTTGAIKDKDFGTTGLQGLGQNLQDFAKKNLSEKLKSEEAETASKVAEAEKRGILPALGTQVGEVLKNPLTQGIGFLAEQIPQAIPSMIAAAIPGVGPAAAAELRAAQAAAKAAVAGTAKKEAADAALKLAENAAKKSQIARGTTAAVGTGAAQQGADIGSGSFEEIKQYLMTEKGMREPEAAAEALNLARASGASGAAISLLAQKLPGAQALERALAGERLGTGRIKGAIAGAIKNIPSEMVEEGGGKVTQNLALRDVNPEQSLTAGLGQTLGQAALGATLIGGGAGAIAGGKPSINPEDVKNAEFEKRKAEDIQRATEKRAEIAKQMEVVKNPIGALTEADLGPELTSYVNKHRTDTGKPTLTAYSLDDVVDALPGKDKVKETAALNALISQKTGYTAEVYTPDAVAKLAEEKNIDTTKPGFGDFLSRSTGINDLAQMSQPQLHSAVTALQKLPAFETKQELPEGTNATRYSPEQLTKAIDGLNAKLDALGKDELTLKETTKVVETATGLKGSAVNALLNDATKSGSIATEGKNVSVPSRTTPRGYDIQEEIGQEEEQADSYDIMRGDEKLRTMDNQEQADSYVEKLNRLTETELKKTEADLKAEDDKITKSEEGLLKLTLEGKDNTPEYQAAELAHQAVLDAAMPVIGELKAKQESYSTPLTVAPIGLKKVQPKTYRVTKGETVKGTKATREEAEQSIFEDLSDKEIQELAKTKSPKLQARVNAEIARRATAPAPEPKTAEQTQKLQAVQASLQSMLGRFGLQDVALKIVNAIEQGADGSYAAKVIQLAIDAQNPIRVLRHESLHALKELGFFTDSQWKALERQAKAEWVDKYLKNNQTKMPDGRVVSRYDAYVEMGLNEEAILEEAIADAFGDFDSTKAPPGMLTALLNKLRSFFSTVKSYLNGQGYESYKDIFGKIEKGELKPSKPAEANKEAKKSLTSFGAFYGDEKQPVYTPLSTRNFMEQDATASQQDLGLNTKAKRGIFNNVRDIARALNQYTIDRFGQMDRNNLSEQQSTQLARAMADEVAFQLGTQAKTGTGLGWYSNNYPKAVKRLASRFPELSDSKHARSVFSALVAVTSNGEKVNKNIDNAITLYSKLRDGKPLVAMGNRRATALENNLKMIQDLLNQHGTNFEKVLLEEITVKEMNARLREMGEDTDGSYLKDTTVPAAAVYFGPKLGAFYANLSGSEGYLTMDLWWTRSVNRMRGLLMPQATEASINKFRNMMDMPSATRDEVIAATIPLRNKYEEYGWNTELEYLAKAKEPAKKAQKDAWFKKAKSKAGAAYDQLLFEHNLEKMANTIYKNEFEMLEEAPFTATDRKFMYDAGRKAQDMLRKDGVNLTLADIQAALWYYEKRLYEKLSGRKADDIGYEEAIIAQSGKTTGRARPSVVFDTELNRRDESGGAVKDTEELRGKSDYGPKYSLREEVRSYRGRNEAEPETHTRESIGDGEGIRVLGVAPIARYRPTQGFKDIISDHGFESPVFYEISSDDAQTYADAIQASKDSTKFGAAVYVYPVEDYAKMRLFLTQDGKSGIALKKDDIVSVFSGKPHRGSANSSLQLAIQEGGRRLDAFDTVLPTLYHANGFKSVGRMTWNEDYKPDNWDKKTFEEFNGGEPDVVYMSYDPDNNETLFENPGPYFDDPDALAEAQARAVKAYATEGEGYGSNAQVERTEKLRSKLSLKTSYPTAEAAEDAAYRKAPPTTDAFKRWFGDSKITEEGRPKVMYHASPKNFNVFRERKPIFISPEPKEAEYFGRFHFFGNERATKPISIYPLWVRAENSFDYENPDHVDEVHNALVKMLGEDFISSESKRRLASGDWSYIEDPALQGIIKDAGFDSFYVKEGDTKNLAVFDANQVKSATGNTGEFGETKDMRFSLREVPLSPDEQQYFDTVFDNKADLADFQEYVPSAELRISPDKMKSTLVLNEDDLSGLDDYLGDVWAGAKKQYGGEGASSLPKSFSSAGNKFLKKARGAEPSIKLSFPSIADQIAQTTNGVNANQRILETTTAREEEGFIERIMSAISPESRSSFRAQAINRYNQMSVNDKKIAQAMGGIELLADSSAEAAALQSDTSAGVAAAVMGYGDSKGGVPIYEKGYTTVSDLNGTVKGLTELLMPLAKRGDPYIFRAFQFYSGVKRGTRLDADGKEKLFEKKDIQYAKDLELLYPEFASVHADWIKYNNGHVDYMVKTGVLTPEKGKIFKKYADYIPFYRQLEGEETFGPNIFQSLANVKAPKKIKGGEAPLADFLETVVRNTQASIQSGMKNIAATRAIDQALFLGTASQLPQVSSAPNTVTLLRNGIPVSYAVSDRLLFDAMQSLHLPEMPFLGILAGPANLLRNLVTKDPGFMLANMMRDSLSAYATSGANMTPIVDTIRNFGSVMANRSPEFVKLVNAGVIGGYEFSRDVVSSGGELAKDLRKKSKTQTESERALRPITSLWGFLEKGTEASDAATRIAVYKDVMRRTGNEAEAIRQAAEVMNFNRKGSSPIIRIVTASIPFLNARIQGLDVLYRAGMAPRPEGVNKTDYQRQVQKNFLIRGATMMALSSMYWFMMKDDDEYKKQEQEVRDNNWILPMINARIPIPFEVGVLFKVIPERILAFAFGNDTGEDLAKSMERALRSTFGVNYIPQTVLPLVEATTNYSYFTMRPIVSQGTEGIRPGLQVGSNTTQIAETVGKALNVSPIMIDHIIQGYTGTMGMYLVNAVDAIFDSMSDRQKPSLRIEQYPILKRFMIDSEAKGSVSAYFELKKAVDETVRTVNALQAGGQGEELADFVEGKHRLFGLENASLLGARGFVTNMDAKMKPLLENARKIRASEMAPDEKREALSTINEALISMTSNIQEIKKGLSQ